jgi:hypothetical protein
MAKNSKPKSKPTAACMKPVQPGRFIGQSCWRIPASADRADQKVMGIHPQERVAGCEKRTLINADENLKAVFGGKKQVSQSCSSTSSPLIRECAS